MVVQTDLIYLRIVNTFLNRKSLSDTFALLLVSLIAYAWPYMERVRTNKLPMVYSLPFLNFPSESQELSFEFEFDVIGIDSLLRKKLIKVDLIKNGESSSALIISML